MRGTACLLAAALLAAAPARASVYDEFEVHGTDIAGAGEPVADLFTSYGLRGIRRASYHGALANDRGVYLTPLIGHGVTSWWESSVLFPTALDRRGQWAPGGAKLHNVLVLPPGTDSRWSFGSVVEATILSRRFQPMTFGWELRPLATWQGGQWSFRGTLGFTGGFGGRYGEAVLSPSVALGRQVTERLALVMEHYAELGPVRRPESLPHQAQQSFLVAQVDLGVATVQLGMGRGLTAASDPWVAKLRLSAAF